MEGHQWARREPKDKPATAATVSSLNGGGATQVTTAYDAEHHRIAALIPDTGKGLEMQLTY